MRGVLRFSGAASSASVTAGAGPVVQLPEEEELELGLSLGAAKAAARCRILTARDFPSLAPRGSPPLSPSNSSVSSSSCAGGCCAAEEEPASRRASSQVQVVGWPPIRAFRMNSLFHHSKDTTATNSVVLADSTSSDKKSGRDDGKEQPVVRKKERSLFVKVNMDGDPIGRKVDLNAHHSYRGLASALELMFHVLSMPPGASRHGVQTLKLLLDGSSEYQLTYEDKDGDWMLVGDVPWGMFLDTVKRLRIMRNSDNCGLVPRVQSSSKLGGRIGSKLS